MQIFKDRTLFLPMYELVTNTEFLLKQSHKYYTKCHFI
jgi:hypothetical protein